MEHTKIKFLSTIKPAQEENSPLQPQAMECLPLGDILCQEGWLGHQLEAMANGMTGRLPEYSPYFRRENNGFLHPEVKKGWEEVPYWLRGFYPLAVLTGEQRLLDTAERYLEAIFASSQPDGWFGPAYLKEYEKMAEGILIPDLYPNMLLTDTLILHHSRTKDPRVIPMLERYFAFCLALPQEAFLPARRGRLIWQKIRAGDMLSQLYWFYRQTGQTQALTLAQRVYSGIMKNHTGFVADHAVDFGHRFAYDAIYSQQSGDAGDFEKSETHYQTFAKAWGQLPRGIFAADERIRPGATDPRQAYEPCGMVELAKNFYELLRISGSTLYSDRTEDVMLNHFPASFTADYRQMHYLTAANCPSMGNYYPAPTRNGSAPGNNRSYTIFTPNNRCCGHNTGMGWPWYAMNLWQKTFDGGLAANLYAPCRVSTKIGGQTLALKVETQYPFEEEIRVTLESAGEFPLYFRIPTWSKKAELEICGEAWQTEEKAGWVWVCRRWQPGDKICLRLQAEISLTRFESNGSVCVDRGPLSYSVRISEEYRQLEEAGFYNHPQPYLWENYEVLPKTAWNYGLCQESLEQIRVAYRAETPAKQPWEAEDPPIVLKAFARPIPQWQLQDGTAAQLQKGPVYSAEPVEEIELIPLGCARLRMSCLPVVTEDPGAVHWQPEPEHIPLELRPKTYPGNGWEL